MDTVTTQQEILLVIETDFTSQQYWGKENIDIPGNSTEREKLQEACWSGMVQERLPEVFLPTQNLSKMYLWQLREADNFLALEMGEYPKEIDHYYSIDPYCFLSLQGEN